MSSRLGAAASAVERARLRYVSPVGVYVAAIQKIREHPANEGHVVRPLATLVAATVFHRLSGQPVVAPLGDTCRVVVEPSFLTPAESASLYGNPPDYPLARVWCAVIRPGDLVLDVGANKGHYTLLAAERGAEVVAFEPSTTTSRLLEANLRLNELDGRVTVRRAAAGAVPGTTLFTTGTGALNHVVESADDLTEDRLGQMFAAHRPSGLEEVVVETIDDVVGDRRVAAMKLDVEGQEEFALQGADRLLSERRVTYLQVETNSMADVHYGRGGDRVLELLRDHGYVIYGVAPDGTPFREGPRPSGDDVLAVDPSGPFWDRLGLPPT